MESVKSVFSKFAGRSLVREFKESVAKAKRCDNDNRTDLAFERDVYQNVTMDDIGPAKDGSGLRKLRVRELKVDLRDSQREMVFLKMTEGVSYRDHNNNGRFDHGDELLAPVDKDKVKERSYLMQSDYENNQLLAADLSTVQSYLIDMSTGEWNLA